MDDDKGKNRFWGFVLPAALLAAGEFAVAIIAVTASIPAQAVNPCAPGNPCAAAHPNLCAARPFNLCAAGR